MLKTKYNSLQARDDLKYPEIFPFLDQSING